MVVDNLPSTWLTTRRESRHSTNSYGQFMKDIAAVGTKKKPNSILMLKLTDNQNVVKPGTS